MTEGSIYSKRWRRWDAIMLYARAALYIVLAVLALAEYFYVNRLAEQGVSFSGHVWTPVYHAGPYLLAISTVVFIISTGMWFPVMRILKRRGFRWLGSSDVMLLALFVAGTVYMIVFAAAIGIDWPSFGIVCCMYILIALMFTEIGRGVLLGAEALTRDQERPGEPPQEPSPD